jgi:hypothetical protein
MTIPPPTDMNSARFAKRKADEERQVASRVYVGTAMIQLAFGKTGGADNMGWELHRPGRAPQYHCSEQLDSDLLD